MRYYYHIIKDYLILKNDNDELKELSYSVGIKKIADDLKVGINDNFFNLR